MSYPADYWIIQESWHLCIIGDDFLNIFFQIIFFFFVTYLFYLTTLGFLKMENKEIMTEVQSHSTPLVLHGPVVTLTQRTIQLIQSLLKNTSSRGNQYILMNSQSGNSQELLLSVVAQFIFIFIFLLRY